MGVILMISITSDKQKEILKKLNILEQAERLERELLALDHIVSVQFENNTDLFGTTYFEISNKVDFIINFDPSLTEIEIYDLIINRVLVVFNINDLSSRSRTRDNKLFYYHDIPKFLDNKRGSAISVSFKNKSMYCSMECIYLKWKSSPKWCIRHIDKGSYLGYQHSDREYFFTDIDTFRKALYNHSYEHPVLFYTEASALRQIKSLYLRNCEVVQWR